MKKIIVFMVVGLVGCSGISPEPPPDAEGPLRPINALSTDERDQLRFVDPDQPDQLQRR